MISIVDSGLKNNSGNMSTYQQDYDGIQSAKTFDYSQWQRRERKIEQKNKYIKSVVLPSTSREQYISSISSSRSAIECHRRPSFGKECSSLCRHGGNTSQPTKLVVKSEQKKQKDGVTNLLKHTDAKNILSKYEKYRGGSTILQNKYEREFAMEKSNLQQTEYKINTLIKVLRSEVQHLDEKIDSEKLALKILLNYKEKEYPDKVDQIKTLKQKIDILTQECEKEFTEVEWMASIEKDSYLESHVNRQELLKADCAQNVLASLDAPTKELFRQNATMRKEIEFHKKEIENHQKEILCLKQQLRTLKYGEAERVAQRKYPESFKGKCLPETDFELDIAVQEWLPI